MSKNVVSVHSLLRLVFNYEFLSVGVMMIFWLGRQNMVLLVLHTVKGGIFYYIFVAGVENQIVLCINYRMRFFGSVLSEVVNHFVLHFREVCLPVTDVFRQIYRDMALPFVHSICNLLLNE